MKKSRIILASLFIALLYMGNTIFADEIVIDSNIVAKDCGCPRCRRGPRGHRGHEGHRGHRGARGFHGLVVGQTLVGVEGTQGIPGIDGGESSTFISATGSLVGPVVNSSPIPYNNLVAQGGSFLPYVSGSGIFITTEPGHYEVIFGAKWTTASTMALRINGATPLQGSRLLATDDYATMSLIVNAPTAITTFEIVCADGGFMTFISNPGTNAFVSIKKIAN
jgi:hypothetical protein